MQDVLKRTDAGGVQERRNASPVSLTCIPRRAKSDVSLQGSASGPTNTVACDSSYIWEDCSGNANTHHTHHTRHSSTHTLGSTTMIHIHFPQALPSSLPAHPIHELLHPPNYSLSNFSQQQIATACAGVTVRHATAAVGAVGATI